MFSFLICQCHDGWEICMKECLCGRYTNDWMPLCTDITFSKICFLIIHSNYLLVIWCPNLKEEDFGICLACQCVHPSLLPSIYCNFLEMSCKNFFILYTKYYVWSRNDACMFKMLIYSVMTDGQTR